jgi:ATPase subunit of ABC transporter with duplicated ATPase domains
MGTIGLRDVGVVSPRTLFQNLTFTVGVGDRIGLIAANGGGKSTLLRCIAGQLDPGSGAVTLSRGLRIGFVEQDVSDNLLDLTLADAVRRALPPETREHEAWRVGAVLDEFDAPSDLHDRPVRALSGGWQRLMLLARVWITEPDALLLDEPTNHLDLEKIRVLEAWIAGPASRTPMLVASHDRSFLDACTNRTLFLRPDISRLYAHPYTRARRLLAADDEAQDRKHAKGAREVDRLRRNAGELRNVGVNSGSDLLQKKSMQLTQRAERLEQTLRPAHVERSADIRLANRGKHAKSLVSIRDLVVRAPDQRALFSIGRLEIRQGDRVVLLGRNGVGKSRFVMSLLRAMTEEAPGMRIHPGVVIGYADQLMSHLPDHQTPHGLIAARQGVGDRQATSLLAGAGFTIEAQGRLIGVLSPGQKARLGLLALRLTRPNLYLLDEPTNHVDIPGQEQLEAEMLEHAATCVLISHDRSFVNAVGTRFLSIAHGALHERDGAAGRDGPAL